MKTESQIRRGTKYKLAKGDLREREARMRLTLEAAQVGTWEIDLLTGKVRFNDQLNQIFGFPPNQSFHSYDEWRARIHPDEQANFDQTLQEAIQGDGEYNLEYRIVRPDGAIRWVASKGRVLHDDAGRGVRVLGIGYDATESKQTEEAIKKQAALIDLSLDAIIVRALDGRIESWNRGAENLYGWTRQEARGKNLHELLRTDFPQPLAQIENELFDTGFWTGELEQVTRDGRRVIVATRWQLQRNASDEPIEILETNADITERRRAAEELCRSEARYRTLFDLVSVAVYTCDAEGVIQEFNQRAAELWGRQPRRGDPQERFCGSFKIFYPDGRPLPHGDCPMARILRGEEVGEEEKEILIERPDGARRNVIASPQPLKNERGQIIGAINCLYDITERKRAEERLRESEEKFAKAFNLSPLQLAISSLEDGRLIEVNESFLQASGYTREEAIGRTSVELGLWVNPRIREEGLKRIKRGEPIKNIEAEFRLRNGEVRVGLVAAEVIELRGKPCALTVVSDITERKHAEDLRSLLASIVEASEDAIFSKSLDGTIRSWNKGAEHLYGYTAEEIIGRSISVLMPPGRADDFPTIMERIKRGESITHYETERMRKDGTRVYVSLAISPLRNAAGKVTGASTIARDITERKSAEQVREELLIREHAARIEAELRRQENARLAEINRELVSALEYQEITAIISRAARELIGADGATFVLREGEQVFYADENAVAPLWKGQRFPVNQCISGMAMLEREPIVIEDIYHDARVPLDAYRVTFVKSLMMVPVGPDAPAAIGVYWAQAHRASQQEMELLRSLAAAADLALARTKSYEEMRRARIEAEEANRLKDEFLANLSHELRTPLTSILGWSRLLQTEQVGQAILPQAIQTIERNARAQLRIVEDLLDISRIISGKLKLDQRELPLAPIVAAAVEIVRPMAELKNIALRTEFDCPVDWVKGDSERLQQIVWNLLSNAVKFTPRGSEVSARLKCTDENEVELTIEDNGQGIAPDFLPFVFDRFRQADGSTTRAQGGLGLGLSITRYLVEMHGGTIRAESAGEGQGAKFIVRLPSAVKEVKPVAPTNGEVNGSLSLAGVKILIVEDDPDARELFKLILSAEGAQVVTVGSAAEGLEQLKQVRFDLLISDIGMSKSDGYELIKRVRALSPEHNGSIPAIALTAYARPDDRARLLASGFQLHVPKPVTPRQLKEAVTSLAQELSETVG